MKKSSCIILAFFSGILLSLSWFSNFSGIISIIAFIPLLFIEDQLYNTREKNKPVILIGFSAITFFIWNILTSYWIHHASFIGFVSVILFNTTLMSSVFGLFHITKRIFGSKIGNIALVIYWLSFEYFYLNAEISWPWLNLGNALAKDIKIIQWYEYTGTLGGSLWILILNILLFNILKKYLVSKNIKALIPKLVFYSLILFIPIFISLKLFNNYQELGNECNIAIIQPNIDPYHEKFDKLSQTEQLGVILNLAQVMVDDSTDYIVCPETALHDSLWIKSLNKNSSIISIKDFINKNPKLNFIIGIDSYKKYLPGEKLSPTVRLKSKGRESFYYDTYNSAILIDTSEVIQIYHKSKLVVGVEKVPYPKAFRFLENMMIDLGGTTASRATQNNRSTFINHGNNVKIAPVICYESVYGEYVTDYIKNGANLIFILTNDGWFGNSIGYKHHLYYAGIRAIETRRSIARSANTGISAFINQKGEILNATKWWTKDAIKNKLKTNNYITFYVKYGDYIGRISAFIAVLLILFTLVQVIKGKSKFDINLK